VDIRNKFGERVRLRREELGLSQEEFAFQSGIHRTYVSGVERGVRNPSLTMIERIAKALELSFSDLLDDAG
jgi:transcriptional regulator with XRE-family HTH domain